MQHRVSEGDRVQLNSPTWAAVGERIRYTKVQLVGGETFTAVGRPLLKNASVEMTVEQLPRHKIMYQYMRLSAHMRGESTINKYVHYSFVCTREWAWVDREMGFLLLHSCCSC